MGGEVSGLVRVGLAPSLGVNVVPNALSKYCVSFPNVTIQLSVGYTNILIENLDAGIIDFAITNDTPKLGSLISNPIMSEELVLVVARKSKFLTSSVPDFNQIPPGRLIVPSSGQVLRSLIDDHLRKTGKTMQSHLELDALMPTMELVKTGEWATIAEAFNAIYWLEMACRVQVDALASGTKLIMPSEAVINRTHHLYQPTVRRPFGLMEWPAMLRYLDRRTPGYKD